MGTQRSPQKGHSSPQFSAHVYCGQTAVCIRIPLGMEVGLSLGDIMWPNGSMDQDATWYGSRPRPRPHCVRRGPGSPSPAKVVQPRPFCCREPPCDVGHVYRRLAHNPRAMQKIERTLKLSANMGKLSKKHFTSVSVKD